MPTLMRARFLLPVISAALASCSSDAGIKSDGSTTKDATTNDGGGLDTTGADSATDSNGADAGVLDCTWLEGSNNCWQTTFAMATACLPPASSTGTLSADSRTCTYASGEVVTFTAALVLPIPSGMQWNLTITGAGGQPCLHYQDSGSGFQLVVGGQTFLDRFINGVGLAFTCPDGTVVENDNAADLLSCPQSNGSLEIFPGAAWASSDSSVSFRLTGTGTLTSFLFSCNKP